MAIVKGILIFIHIIISVTLMIVILLQSSKGGGLAGTFGGQASTTIFGPRGTKNVLAKATQYLAVIFLCLSFTLSFMAGAGQVVESVTQKVLQQTPASQLQSVEQLNFGESTPAAGADEVVPLDEGTADEGE